MKLRRNDTVMSAATVGPASPCRALDFSDDPPGPVVDDDAPLPTWHSSYGDLRSRLDYTRRLHGGMRDEQISDLCSALGIPNLTDVQPLKHALDSCSAREKENPGELPEQLTPLPSILVLGPKGTGKSSVIRQLLSGVLLRSRVHRSAEAAFNGARPVGRVFGHGEGIIEEETTQETFRIPTGIPKCSGCTGDNIVLYADCGLCSSVGNVMTSLLTALDRILADPDIQVKSTSSPSPAKKKNHPKSADVNSPPTRRRSVRAGTPGSGTPARRTRGRAASATVCTPGGTGPETETPVRRSARKAARNDRMWLADRDRFTLSDDASQDHNPVESISSRLPGRLEPVAEDISDYGGEDDTEMTAASSVTSSVTTSAKLPPEDMQAIARRFLQSVVDGPGGAAELTVPKTLPSSVTQQIDRYSKNSVRRVDGSGFAKKLTDLLRRYDALQKTLVLVVDRAERLLPDAAYALQPATEAARLIEFLLNMSDELCLPTACSVLVSSTPILRDSGGVVRFPPYTNSEAVALLSAYCHARAPIRDIPGAVTAFSEMYVKLFYDALTVVDMGILLENALEIYVVEYLNIVNETWGRATVENCEAEDEDDSFGSAVYDEVISVSQIELKRKLEDEVSRTMSKSKATITVKWESHLSYNARLLVLAGFLASHNPPSMDKRLFMMKTGRNSRATVTKMRNNQMAMDSIAVRPPKPFPLQRMLEIARYLHHGEMRMTADVFQEVRRLVHLRLLMTNGEPSIDAWMEGSVKLTTGLHAYPVVEELAASINANLTELVL
ncbi:Origin recognition complex subunit 5 [Perkinsus olseni]|uniref:Origin recognition complex subunit 5 n=1 Tax=Perkinsus olseni TaxID=32597 RepID=A0A7J6SZM4_PEROL|nr:Origin recognition complex subunit 5 [Perkinsus olseni]